MELIQLLSLCENQSQRNEILCDWFVVCAITEKLISVKDVKYWDVEKQEFYSTPYVVPGTIYEHLTSPKTMISKN